MRSFEINILFWGFLLLSAQAASPNSTKNGSRCHCVPLDASKEDILAWIIKPYLVLSNEQDLLHDDRVVRRLNEKPYDLCVNLDKEFLTRRKTDSTLKENQQLMLHNFYLSFSNNITTADDQKLKSDCKEWNDLFAESSIKPEGKEKKKMPLAQYVWMASTISSIIISSVGLLGVAVVPLIQKVFFSQIIQYLVAVAVGTLVGDVFLHQIPHALSKADHGHGHGAEEGLSAGTENGLKGLMAIGGVYFFFIAEKFVTIVSEHRAEKKAQQEEKKRLESGMHHPRKSVDIRRMSALHGHIQPGVGTTLALPPEAMSPLRRPSRQLAPLPDMNCKRASRAMSIVDENILTTGLTSRAMRNIDNLYRYTDEYETDSEEDDKASNADNAVKDGDKKVEADGTKDDEQIAVSIQVPSVPVKRKSEEHEHGHEHSEKKAHGHGHSHEIPESVAAVAWMVIMGDGLHNFTDGIAIGVAFASSIPGGISTTVAIFCHELPHELGDFAVLLKSGMQIKHAMFFNIVSSVLSFLGMVLGIALGSMEEATGYITMFTAGTFIYISLVDMLPELSGSEVKQGESRLLQFLIQNVGIFTGVGVMFLISFYEDSLMRAFKFSES